MHFSFHREPLRFTEWNSIGFLIGFISVKIISFVVRWFANSFRSFQPLFLFLLLTVYLSLNRNHTQRLGSTTPTRLNCFVSCFSFTVFSFIPLVVWPFARSFRNNFNFFFLFFCCSSFLGVYRRRIHLILEFFTTHETVWIKISARFPFSPTQMFC